MRLHDRHDKVGALRKMAIHGSQTNARSLRNLAHRSIHAGRREPSALSQEPLAKGLRVIMRGLGLCGGREDHGLNARLDQRSEHGPASPDRDLARSSVPIPIGKTSASLD
jgi:hypothetical protein